MVLYKNAGLRQSLLLPPEHEEFWFSSFQYKRVEVRPTTEFSRAYFPTSSSPTHRTFHISTSLRECQFTPFWGTEAITMVRLFALLTICLIIMSSTVKESSAAPRIEPLSIERATKSKERRTLLHTVRETCCCWYAPCCQHTNCYWSSRNVFRSRIPNRI